MNYTKCTGSHLALEYNEKHLYNIKLACYCPYCCITTEREPTPYKIIQTENGYTEYFDESYQEIKDKKTDKSYEIVPKSDNPLDPWSYSSP